VVIEVGASVCDVEIWNVCVVRVYVLGIFRLDHEKLKSVVVVQLPHKLLV